MGWMSHTAASAVLAAGFVFYTWLVHDADPMRTVTSASSRPAPAGSTTTVPESDLQSSLRTRSGRLNAGSDFAVRLRESVKARISARWSLSDRFEFNPTLASGETVPGLAPFDDRFSGGDLSSRTFVPTVATRLRARSTRAAAATGAPHTPARTAISRTGQKQTPKAAIQLASASETSLALGYAPADTQIGADGFAEEPVAKRSGRSCGRG